MTSPTSTTSSILPLADLQRRFRRRVIGPEDADYDAARAVMYGGFDKRPAAIVRVAGADDVRGVIAVARETGLPLSVKSGGHSSAGHSTNDGGLVLDLHELRGLEIDPETETAWAETGLTAVEVSEAAAAHRLAIGFGDTGSVGIGGITLGGGIGYLVRKHGLTVDSLLAAEIITADGELLRASEDEHADLFWAIRGGGGNFGVATRFHYQMHRVPGIVGGMLLLPATAETVAGFVELAEAAPEELSSIANVMPIPPMPFVPEEHHGRLGIMALMCYALPDDDPDSVAAGVAALAPFRALATPIADQLAPMPYPAIYPPEDPDYHPLAVARTMFMDHVDASTAEVIVDRLNASDAPMRVCQLRVLGGAMARVPADATAFAHRSSRILNNVAAFHDGTAEDLARRSTWVDETVSALDQGHPGVYVNFLADEGADRVRAAYPDATWDRLVAAKRRYDPDNLFRLNQNIPPTG